MGVRGCWSRGGWASNIEFNRNATPITNSTAPTPTPRADVVVQEVHQSSTVASGALVLAGVTIWMSLGEGPIDLSSLPVAVAAVALTMGGLAWNWLEDPGGADFRLRLSDLRPY